MRARAPGKLVLSGAYAVLEGAPALVAAVDRYVEADASRPAAFEAAEVLEAVRRQVMAAAPWFDASALRADGRKLGLGSSAAILTASLAAAAFEGVEDDDLAATVFPRALEIHRAAQGGGSGVDVAAACFGGICCCRLEGEALTVSPHVLPEGLVIEVFACGRSASTREMLAQVARFAAETPAAHRALMSRLGEAAARASAASDAESFIAALGEQREILDVLGRSAGCPIVTDEVRALDMLARGHGARFAPSGAGGGDVALHHGSAPSPPAFREAARRAGLAHVAMQIGARGLHRIAP